MKLTLGQAAKQAGMSKSTLSRAIKKSGTAKLSAERLDDSSYAIDPAELERWLHSNGHRNTKSERIATPDETPETPHDFNRVEAELKALQERFDDYRQMADRERRMTEERVDELREERDRWRSMAEGQLRQIEDMRTKAEKEIAEAREKAAERRGLFGWLMGRKSA